MKSIILSISLLFSLFFKERKYINEDAYIEDLEIQPKKALDLAKNLIGKHGTFIWSDAKNLRTHIVKRGKYYYIKRSDYPAKAANWYTIAPAIQINGKTGKTTFVTK